MKLKHLIGIFAFLTSFAVSVLLVGTQVSTFSRTKCFDHKRTVLREKPSVNDNETQKRIREFLEKDRQTGIELSSDKMKFSQTDGALNVESMATLNLVKKMQAVKCDGLPADFCAAWDEHRKAWETMAFFLDKDEKRKNRLLTKNPMLTENEWHQILTREINRTYDAMLGAARRHGVDFRD